MHDSPVTGSDRNEAARRIIDAAGLLFAEHGYGGVSIRDIAAAAGISKANVFHHFANKDELYAAAMSCCAEPLKRLLSDFSQLPGSTEQVLAQALHEHLAHMLEHPSPLRLLLRELLGDRGGENQDIADRLLTDDFSVAIDSIRALQEQDRIAADVDPTALAAMVFGSHLVFFLCRDVLGKLPGGERLSDSAGYNQALLRILGLGIVPRPTEQ